MKIPNEFLSICRRLHQDVDLLVSSADHLTEYVLDEASTSDKVAIRAFLEGLLDGSHSEQEIQEMWLSTPAEIYFKDGRQLTTFLKMILSSIK